MDGKILQKELYNRLSDKETKECIAFDYDMYIEDEKGRPIKLTFRFNKIAEKEWEVTYVSKIPQIGELRAYNARYEIPIRSLNLEMVCAMGLRYIQYIMKTEVQYKSMIDFCIGDNISGMQ